MSNIAQQAWKHIIACKKAVAKAKAKAGVVHHQWPIGRSTTYKPRTRTILVARGCTINGVYHAEWYMKEGDL